MLHHGLSEQVINSAMNSELAEIPEVRKAITPIDKAEHPRYLLSIWLMSFRSALVMFWRMTERSLCRLR